MKKGPFILFRVFGLLLVLGLIVGAGAFSFKAGEARGVMQAPAVAAAIEKAAEDGQAVPPMYGYGQPYGYGYGMHGYGHHAGFFPFGAICGSIFFLFFFFGFMKMMFFRRMHHGGHHGHHGPWGKGWEGGAPSMFNEWHKRAHGETPAEDESENKEEGDKKE
ncbi:MAG: hypothetical protein AABZ00_15700 [Chloroflexota bacterium]|jgi:hypothetical protein